MIDFLLAIKSALIKAKGCRNRAIGIELVRLNRIEGVFLKKSGILAITYQSPIKRGRSTYSTVAIGLWLEQAGSNVTVSAQSSTAALGIRLMIFLPMFLTDLSKQSTTAN